MGAVKRPALLSLTVEDSDALVDLGELLNGGLGLVSAPQTRARSALSEEPVALEEEELSLVTGLCAEHWTPIGEAAEQFGVPAKRIRRLARLGLLVEDSDSGTACVQRQRNEKLEALGWHPQAAAYHLSASWRGVRSISGLPARAPGTPPRQPPPTFRTHPAARAVTPLDSGTADGEFFDVLMRRGSTREFDPDEPLGAGTFATLMRYSAAQHGAAETDSGCTLLKKTVASGGSLHPLEIYPLVMRIEGFEPGLYHYSVAEHAMEMLQPMASETAKALATDFACGQAWCGSAAVALIMTLRFERSFWKYRNHPKAYRVLMMDTGHMSQTLYLISTALGLGACVTAAINDGDIADRIGLDAMEESAVAMFCCGVPARGG